MHADAVTLHKILNPTLQMIVPIFQRSYSWKPEQIETLWEDINKVYKGTLNDKTTHFLGPIVRIEIPTSSVDTRKLYLQFCEILDIIEAFVIRRFFCRYPSNKLIIQI